MATAVAVASVVAVAAVAEHLQNVLGVPSTQAAGAAATAAAGRKRPIDNSCVSRTLLVSPCVAMCGRGRDRAGRVRDGRPWRQPP